MDETKDDPESVVTKHYVPKGDGSNQYVEVRQVDDYTSASVTDEPIPDYSSLSPIHAPSTPTYSPLSPSYGNFLAAEDSAPISSSSSSRKSHTKKKKRAADAKAKKPYDRPPSKVLNDSEVVSVSIKSDSPPKGKKKKSHNRDHLQSVDDSQIISVPIKTTSDKPEKKEIKETPFAYKFKVGDRVCAKPGFYAHRSGPGVVCAYHDNSDIIEVRHDSAVNPGYKRAGYGNEYDLIAAAPAFTGKRHVFKAGDIVSAKDHSRMNALVHSFNEETDEIEVLHYTDLKSRGYFYKGHGVDYELSKSTPKKSKSKGKSKNKSKSKSKVKGKSKSGSTKS